MGTSVELLTSDGVTSDGEPLPATAQVEAVFAREELRFSRFRRDSELSQANSSSGEWTDVSPPFEALVRQALLQAELTEGLFDPTV
jgi:thiamine biosynthesis lipoprotein